MSDHHRQTPTISEAASIFSVVQQDQFDRHSTRDGATQASDIVRIRARTLQKAAVTPQYFFARAAGQPTNASFTKMIGLSSWRGSVISIGIRVARQRRTDQDHLSAVDFPIDALGFSVFVMETAIGGCA